MSDNEKTLYLWVVDDNIVFSPNDPDKEDHDDSYDCTVRPPHEPGIKYVRAEFYVQVVQNVLEQAGVKVRRV